MGEQQFRLDLDEAAGDPRGHEVHEHCIIRGDRAHKTWCNKIVHSHPGGHLPHQHADTGPASFTIDKDDWFRATGLRGGGRKKFTKKPTGEQFPIVELEPWQTEFEVIYAPPPKDWKGTGGGMATASRMILGSKMKVSKITDTTAA
jgi:hypothetical protein